MTQIHTSHERNLPSQRHGTDQPLGAVQRLFGGLVRGWQRRGMIRVFEAMDDRLLRDIGVERGDIKDMVNAFDDRELRMVPLPRPLGAITAGQPACAKAA